MSSPAEIRARLRAAARGLLASNGEDIADAAAWLDELSARDLLRADGVARQWRVDGLTLGAPETWTDEVLQRSEVAAVIGAMHFDGFARERALRQLIERDSILASKMIAIRAGDHVRQIRDCAVQELARRTSLRDAAAIVAILDRSDGRKHGSQIRDSYLSTVISMHGDRAVWQVLRESSDRDMRRAAYRHSALVGYLDCQLALDELPRERDQVVRSVLARLVADSGDADAIQKALLRARAADARVLGLVRLNARDLPPAEVERLLSDSSVLVRWWARRRWAELGEDPRSAYRRAIAGASSAAFRARAYIGLAESGQSIPREELLALISSNEPPLVKVGLQMLADDARPADKEMLLSLAGSSEPRIARLACEALAKNPNIWTLTDVEQLQRSDVPALRRRSWWLRRSRGGWEAVIADLDALRDSDRSIAELGRSPQLPRFSTPTDTQRSQVRELLAGAQLRREQKLGIALAAGLPDLLVELRDLPRYEAKVQPTAVRTSAAARPWWRRWGSN